MMSLSRLLIGPALEQRACHARRGPARETTRSSRIELVISEWVVRRPGARHVESRRTTVRSLEAIPTSAGHQAPETSLRESARVQAWHTGCRGGQRTNRFVEPTMKAVPSVTIAVAALLSAVTPAVAGGNDAPAPVLSLEQAVDVAYRHNHLLASTARGVSEAEERSAAIRTRRLPALHVDAFGGRLLNSFQLAIPAGALGTIGAFPTKDNSLTVPTSWSGAAMVSISQPITQQYRIGLNLDIAQLDRQIAAEDLRRERQRVAAEVRTTYYQISAREAGIVALRDLVRSVEELDSVTSRYFAESLVLRSDALEVRARLPRERQRLEAAESELAAHREHLNQLLGRDVLEPFRVASPSALAPPAASLNLETSRQRAQA